MDTENCARLDLTLRKYTINLYWSVHLYFFLSLGLLRERVYLQKTRIMWQRAQTVYLALVIISMSLTLALPFAVYPMESGDTTFNLFGLSPKSESATVWFPYYIVIGLIIGLALFGITQFKNRKRQLNLGKINYLLILGMVVMLFIDTSTIAGDLSVSEESIKYQFGLYLPVAAFAFTFLANRRIKKDEELVKSVERLR